MEKWLVLYSSVSGNTASVAAAMLEAAPPGSVCKNIKDVEDPAGELAEYGVVAAGYWLKLGGPDMLMRQFLPQITSKQVILFETHGTMPKSEHAVTAVARAAYLLGKDCEVLGTFGCQGKINPALLAKRHGSAADDPHGPSEANKERWASAALHPNEADFAAVRAFAGAMVKKIQTLQRYREKIQAKAGGSFPG